MCQKSDINIRCDIFNLQMHRKSLSAGAPPRTSLEELTTLPQTLVGWGGGKIPTVPPRRLRRLDLIAGYGASIARTLTENSWLCLWQRAWFVWFTFFSRAWWPTPPSNRTIQGTIGAAKANARQSRPLATLCTVTLWSSQRIWIANAIVPLNRLVWSEFIEINTCVSVSQQTRRAHHRAMYGSTQVTW